MDEQPLAHLVDDLAHGVRCLDGERLGIGGGGHERQHHHVGVGVAEHVLDELVRAQALERRLAAGALRREAERVRRGLLHPSAARVDEVALHVEDELALRADRRLRQRFIQCRLGRQVEIPAGARVRLVEGEERAGGAGGGDQEPASAQSQALGIRIRRLVREPVRPVVARRQRHRREFAIGRGVELDRQAAALGIVHGGSFQRTSRSTPYFSPRRDYCAGRQGRGKAAGLALPSRSTATTPKM